MVVNHGFSGGSAWFLRSLGRVMLTQGEEQQRAKYFFFPSEKIFSTLL
jgi:hypothetical protein